MHYSTLIFSTFALTTWAWLPSERNLFNVTGPTDAFEIDLPAGNGRTVKRTLPSSGKIRGVNLGSLFIVEPWMTPNEWSKIGCSSVGTEFDCVSKLGQAAADSAFQAHWARWITEADIIEMTTFSLNTIRIPVGYWMMESLVDPSEHFPRGGIQYLEKVCGWAADHGMYVIIDLHGAPMAQVAHQPFTGQNAPTDGFYTTSQYDRAYQFLTWMTNIIHTNSAYRTVGTLEVLNEPTKGHPSMISEYYPKAYAAIRAAEASNSVSPANQLHVQFMSKTWGSGDPSADLGTVSSVWFDNHRYLKYSSSVAANQASYLKTSCHDDVSGETDLVIGEWSLSTANQDSADFQINDKSNNGFYQDWFKAQAMAYEKQKGWIFWSWKAEIGDWRWSFRDAVNAGIIPQNLDMVYSGGACEGI